MAATDERGWDAVAEWYHGFFTGMVLSAIGRRSARAAADLVFAVFRRQHREMFLPGLKKLGLDRLPPAVAAAQYHYLSNAIGGVAVEYVYESDQKAWVRYPPPRWMWQGTAICAVPGEVSRAMLHAWHGENGMTLGHPNVGLVCTGQTVEGDPGLEGYFQAYDRPLPVEERVRFARHETMPLFDPTRAPVLPAEWTAARQRKAHRNYAIAYVRTAIPAAIQLWGAEEAVALLGLTGRLVGMQLYQQTAAGLGVSAGGGADGFAAFLHALALAQGDQAERTGATVRQTSWQAMRGVADLHPAAIACWNALLEGALAAHDRRLQLAVTGRLDLGDPAFVWTIAPTRGVAWA